MGLRRLALQAGMEVYAPPIKTPIKLEDFGSVLAQDARRVPNVQQGNHSRAFKGIILSESELRIRPLFWDLCLINLSDVTQASEYRHSDVANN